MYIEKRIIWSNYDPDYEKDFKDDIETHHPELSDVEQRELMLRLHKQRLDDIRDRMDIVLPRPIAAIMLTNDGSPMRCSILGSSMKECFTYCSFSRSEWYLDQHNDLRQTAVYDDWTDRYLYRAFHAEITDRKIASFKHWVDSVNITLEELSRYTRRLGDEVLNALGLDGEDDR